ncbi:alkaline phosphatase D family protein [Sphingomonas sp. LB-2]|uniref:alkaline phosphatase D family protein n=1 Tax=Sphingomonas caeni TaxID=2984949 RepID=UPI00222F8EA0|nr:alkaline phosphatase D family protein [Sphingomonas caeni]MCW3846375.1 alkaline phosphatase D family protein [Sphingomonas caeni]
MTLRIDRRTFVLTGTLGIGALTIPGFARAMLADAAGGFTHGVASGEPGQDSMLFWTRYVPPGGGEAKVRVEVSETSDFTKALGGETVTGPWRDHTAKITVAGLKPGTRYFYRFVAPDGSFSPVGRTKTLPGSRAASYKMAIFSCSNLAFGWFNAYGHAARRTDLDLAVHLGDYIYEYAPNVYPNETASIAARLPQPLAECLHLADYRLRYASYRSDPDCQALHAALPMLVQTDDHEYANDTWEGGAQNHQADEGDWMTRRLAAEQAWHEWMPVSDEPWKAYQIGGLATFFRTESRALARSRPTDPGDFFKAANPAAAMIAFRDGEWRDSSRTMLGSAQEAWLSAALAASVRAGTHWQVTGFGTIMGTTLSPNGALAWLSPDAPKYARDRVVAGEALAKAGLPFNMDNWGGYPAARARFLKSAQAAAANLVVVCGDSHNGWAFDLGQDGKPAGVEFAGQGVTSAGFEATFAADPKVIAAALVARNPELKWCDTSRRGYMALTLTPEKASNDWVFVDTVTKSDPGASVGHTATVTRGRNVMA